MTLGSWLAAGGLGLLMCGIMWYYGRTQYREGWEAGFKENLELRIADIKDGLASRIEVYYREDEDEE